MSARYKIEDRGYTTPCWTWLLSKNNRGYGRVRVRGKEKLAHRHYYEEKFGPIPLGLVLDHLCRNSDCVNPGHTEPVTQAVNVQRGRKAVITREIAEAIRTMRVATGASHRVIAERFGVDLRTAGRIIKGEAWA